MHHKRRNHDKRPTHRPMNPTNTITPTNTAVGLASKINQDFVLQVFAGSERTQIENILTKAGFKHQGPSRGPSLDRPAAVQAELQAYLRSVEGLRERQRVCQEALKTTAADWLASPAGQRELTRTKADLLASKVPTDADIFLKASSAALSREVEKWLRSPLGQAQVEQEKQKALRQQIAKDVVKGPSWVEREIKKGVKDAD